MGRSRVLTPEGGGDYYRSPAGKVQKPPAAAEYTPQTPSRWRVLQICSRKSAQTASKNKYRPQQEEVTSDIHQEESTTDPRKESFADLQHKDSL